MLVIGPAIVLATVVGVPMGILAAVTRGKVWDPVLSASALVAFSLPVFVTGTLLVLVLSVHLQWLPATGFIHPADDFTGFLRRAILPIVSLAAAPTAITMRMTRAPVLDQLGLDYARTARAKGLAERVVLFRQVLRNALIPVVTVVGLQLGNMFAGSVLVEVIFNWPGLSTFLLDAVGMRDYPVVQAVVLVTAALFLLINMVTDLAYAFLDPRIRYS